MTLQLHPLIKLHATIEIMSPLLTHPSKLFLSNYRYQEALEAPEEWLSCTKRISMIECMLCIRMQTQVYDDILRFVTMGIYYYLETSMHKRRKKDTLTSFKRPKWPIRPNKRLHLKCCLVFENNKSK